MNNPTTFYIARHGETEHNVQGIIQGQNDSPLTTKGLEQAKNLASDLKEVKFDLVLSSDLLRAKRTAEVVAKEQALEVEATEMLRERNWGELEGRPSAEYNKNFREYIQALSHEERYTKQIVPGFESDEEMMKRFIPFIRETALAVS